jgi:alpha-L-arabinofuranosidase
MSNRIIISADQSTQVISRHIYGHFTDPSACSVSASSIIAEPFALRQVELLDSPFKGAMERNAKYLLSLDPDRLLHNARKYGMHQIKSVI